MASTTTTPLDAAKSLVALARKAIDVFGRRDLDDRLVRAEHNLSDRSVHVVVVGEFKQGKSSLVNALLNADICPVDDDIANRTPDPRTRALPLPTNASRGAGQTSRSSVSTGTSSTRWVPEF